MYLSVCISTCSYSLLKQMGSNKPRNTVNRSEQPQQGPQQATFCGQARVTALPYLQCGNDPTTWPVWSARHHSVHVSQMPETGLQCMLLNRHPGAH